MGLLNFFSGEDKTEKLFRLGNFEANYLLTVSNEFIMGKENPVISLNTESDISLQQLLDKNKIYTSVTVNTIRGKTDNNTMKPHLQQMLILGGISKKINFERNARGKILRVTNKEELNKEWHAWKESELPQVFTDKKEQMKFAENFEKGLAALDKNIKNNLSYLIFLPAIYHSKKYISDSNATDELILPSKLIADMMIRYRFAPTDIKDLDISMIKLNSEIVNREEMRREHLKKYYKDQKEFKIEDYDFAIDIDYCIERNTGKIISGNLFLKEKMHDRLQYILHIHIDEVVNEKEEVKQLISRASKRTFLADENINPKE